MRGTKAPAVVPTFTSPEGRTKIVKSNPMSSYFSEQDKNDVPSPMKSSFNQSKRSASTAAPASPSKLPASTSATFDTLFSSRSPQPNSAAKTSGSTVKDSAKETRVNEKGKEAGKDKDKEEEKGKDKEKEQDEKEKEPPVKSKPMAKRTGLPRPRTTPAEEKQQSNSKAIGQTRSKRSKLSDSEEIIDAIAQSVDGEDMARRIDKLTKPKWEDSDEEDVCEDEEVLSD